MTACHAISSESNKRLWLLLISKRSLKGWLVTEKKRTSRGQRWDLGEFWVYKWKRIFKNLIKRLKISYDSTSVSSYVIILFIFHACKEAEMSYYSEAKKKTINKASSIFVRLKKWIVSLSRNLRVTVVVLWVSNW